MMGSMGWPSGVGGWLLIGGMLVLGVVAVVGLAAWLGARSATDVDQPIESSSDRRLGIGGALGAGIALVAAGLLLSTQPWSMMAGHPSAGTGMMGVGGGMMSGRGATGGLVGPGQVGFVAGTTTQPRVVRIVAGPGEAFTPATLEVARGETITFVVTSMGGLVHEFMVGPAAAVATDAAGTPEIADLGMMATGTLTYTFDGPGPYAFACHAPGHYEAGMRGSISVLG